MTACADALARGIEERCVSPQSPLPSLHDTCHSGVKNRGTRGREGTSSKFQHVCTEQSCCSMQRSQLILNQSHPASKVLGEDYAQYTQTHNPMRQFYCRQ